MSRVLDLIRVDGVYHQVVDVVEHALVELVREVHEVLDEVPVRAAEDHEGPRQTHVVLREVPGVNLARGHARGLELLHLVVHTVAHWVRDGVVAAVDEEHVDVVVHVVPRGGLLLEAAEVVPRVHPEALGGGLRPLLAKDVPEVGLELVQTAHSRPPFPWRAETRSPRRHAQLSR